jgi:hypothetical protein
MNRRDCGVRFAYTPPKPGTYTTPNVGRQDSISEQHTAKFKEVAA